MARIYVSSTFGDLKEHRQQVYRALRQLGHDVIAMEDYVATDQRPVAKCLEDVAGCDIYVGVFAHRYGYIPPRAIPIGARSPSWNTATPMPTANPAWCSCSTRRLPGQQQGWTPSPGRTRAEHASGRCTKR